MRLHTLRSARHVSLVLFAVVVAAIGISSVGRAQSPNNLKPSRTTFSSSAKQAVQGDNVTLKATVAAVATADGTPTGTVEFFDGATSLGSVSLSATATGTEASVTLNTLAVGPHPITAVYSGDGTFGGSVTPPEMVLIVAHQ